MLRFFLRAGLSALFPAIFVSLLLSQQLAFKQYNRAAGLPSDYIICMMQDRHGFLWFGTDRGASRYDGRTFKTFTVADGLGSNFVRRIFEDREGNIWFGLIEGGIARFTGTRIQRYTTADGLSSNNVLAIAQDHEGRLYFKTDRGISIFTKNRFLQLPTKTASNVMSDLPDGTIAFHDSLSLYRIVFEDRAFPRLQELHVPSYRDFAVNPAGPQEMRLLRNGEVCVIGRYGALFISYILHPQPSVRWLERAREFMDVAERDGTVWLIMENIPHLVSLRNGVMKYHKRRDAVPGEELTTLLADREGNLWIGTLGNGAMRLLGEHMRVYTTASGLPTQNITTVFEDSRRRVWFGSSEGVSLLANGQMSSNVRPLLRVNEAEIVNGEFRNVRSFAEDHHGRLVIGTFMRFIGPTTVSALLSQQSLRSRPIPWGVSAIYVEPGDQMTGETSWVATYGNGTYRFRKSDSTKFYRKDGIVSDMIEAIVPGMESVWFLSRNHGASRWKNETFETYSTNSIGLTSDAIYSLYEESSDRIWFGTDRGLLLYDRGQIRTFDGFAGLMGTYVYGIIPNRSTSLPDRDDGSLWVITDKMVHRVKGEAIVRYGSSPLLHADDASVNRVYHVRGTTRIWVATTKGAVLLDLSLLRRANTPPPITLTEISADTLQVSLPEASARKWEFPYTINELTIQFAGLSYSHEPSVRYQYRLEEREERWSLPTSESTVRYRHLPPGTYTFVVRAINPDGVASTEPARFSFVILPPFYGTWWFRTLMATSLVGALGGAIRYVEVRKYRRALARLEREKAVSEERERTRARIARDLHDDLSSTLGSIALYSESLKRSVRNASKETNRLLERISALSVDAVDAIGDIVWSVAPQHDTLGSLIERMKHVAAELCTLNKINYSIQFPAVEDEIHLRDQVRRNLYLIFKEALTNSIRHSQAREIRIHGRLDHGTFELALFDDGIGLRMTKRVKQFEKGRPSTGHGLQNMKARAEEIGAEFELRSRRRKGTAVRVQIRLQDSAQPGKEI
ncbi:MAG: hybrid sensor histidine kinase/response regulator [Bacteroidia bacterium]|nr:MAG: hybrid sensor histidine kinase/response regulator [Bacteroidia bacterium]